MLVPISTVTVLHVLVAVAPAATVVIAGVAVIVILTIVENFSERQRCGSSRKREITCSGVKAIPNRNCRTKEVAVIARGSIKKL